VDWIYLAQDMEKGLLWSLEELGFGRKIILICILKEESGGVN
jgi:hypothetical protein